jgi:hypothetical protein
MDYSCGSTGESVTKPLRHLARQKGGLGVSLEAMLLLLQVIVPAMTLRLHNLRLEVAVVQQQLHLLRAPMWVHSHRRVRATCPTARGSAFPRGELRCCHVSHGPRWVVDHMNKEQLGSRVSKVRSCVTEASADVQVATMHIYSAASAQLITPGHGYNGDTTRQDGTTGRAMFSVAER